MQPDWWPALLRFIASDDLWSESQVPVARLFSVPNGDNHPGEFRSFTALVPVADLQQVLAMPRGLSHEVSASGPHPWKGAAPTYSPSFWVDAQGLPKGRYEPLVLSWVSNNQTVLVPDPHFLMTYGLVPRCLSNGRIRYDDPQTPIFDVVEVDPPSIWDIPNRTTAVAKISRDYLQDYLTLRGVALFEIYYAIATGDVDEECLAALAGADNIDIELPDRLINLQHAAFQGENTITAQVWGARLIAGPKDLPITDDPLAQAGLNWPGFSMPIGHKEAMGLGIADYVYVNDKVLAPYEDRPGFEIYPESGGVSYGNQWGVGFSQRIGRDTIRLELKKLYEGVPPSAIKNWHAHAIIPTAAMKGAGAQNEPNIATRAKSIVLTWSDIGLALSELANALGLGDFRDETFVKLDRKKLDYYGWWSPAPVIPITRHVPLDMDRPAFLQRCVALNNLLTEGIGQPALRKVLEALKIPTRDHAGWKGLKLLNEVICLAQVARATGLSLIGEPELVRDALKADGTDPSQPIASLFALYDLRLVGAHTSSDVDRELRNGLQRFGVEAEDFVGGFGRTMDQVYDAIATDLAAVRDVLNAVR